MHPKTLSTVDNNTVISLSESEAGKLFLKTRGQRMGRRLKK